MATVAGAGVLAAVMAFTASGHVIKTTSFDLVVIDAWPGAGGVSSSFGLSATGHAVKSGIAVINAVSNFTATVTTTGSGSFSATLSVTGSGHIIAGGSGTISAQFGFSATGKPIWGGAGVVSPAATFSAKGTATFQGRGIIPAVSNFGAVCDAYTIANKEFYVKDNGEWVKVFPTVGLATDWDGGTF